MLVLFTIFWGQQISIESRVFAESQFNSPWLHAVVAIMTGSAAVVAADGFGVLLVSILVKDIRPPHGWAVFRGVNVRLTFSTVY